MKKLVTRSGARLVPVRLRIFILLFAEILLLPSLCIGQTTIIRNPILEGFNPDPSICRVGDDYFICTSSFTWFPGLPIYHSKDLVNWELAGHAIDRKGMINLDGVKDKDGVWAPTIRYHNGKFYIFCNVSNGGNFFITATALSSPVGEGQGVMPGPWSDPIFIKDEQGRKMPGIDPDIFWDDDGQSYVIGNAWGYGLKSDDSFKKSSFKDKDIAIWIQAIDLTTGTLKGERKYISAGCFINSKNAEGPHLYRIDMVKPSGKASQKKYVLLIAEGGTDYYHSETVMTSDSLFGPYVPQKVNPVLSNRHLGHGAPIQCVGHADLVQTPDGGLFAVCLGKRMLFDVSLNKEERINSSQTSYSFTREVFLCPVKIEDGEFIFNPGYGCMTQTVKILTLNSQLSTLNSQLSTLNPQLYWYYERIPHEKFETWRGNEVTIKLMPETIDSLASPALLLRKVSPMGFEASVKLSFSTKKANEEAGIVLHRNNQAYMALLKTKGALRLVTCCSGRKTIVATVPYKAKDVVMRLNVEGLKAVFCYGESEAVMQSLPWVSTIPLAESRPLNRFNGVGFGMYATSNGRQSAGNAAFSGIKYE